jgi:phage baseplate assembly protein W
MAANQTVTIYGSQPTRLVQEGATQHKKNIFGLSYPLGKKQESGGYFQKATGVELIKGAVSQLLLTERGERVMLPKFGCNLRKFLFQPLDENTFEEIKEEIRYSFHNYIVGAKILKLAVYPTGPAGPGGGNSLMIRLNLGLVEDDLTVFDVEVQVS